MSSNTSSSCMKCSVYLSSQETQAQCRRCDRTGRWRGSGPWGRCLAAILRSRWSRGYWWAATRAAWGSRTPAPPAHHISTVMIDEDEHEPGVTALSQYLNDAVALRKHFYILHFKSSVLQSPTHRRHRGTHAVLLQTCQKHTRVPQCSQYKCMS